MVYFLESSIFDGELYDVAFNIRDKGKEQYQYLISFNEVNKKATQSSHTVTNEPPANITELPSMGDSISQTEPNVNTGTQKNSDGDLSVTIEDIQAVQSVGRKSINDFTSEDIKKTESFARKY